MSLSKNIAFIIPYPLSQAPSQRFRFEQYFNALVKKGIKYEAYSFLSKRGFSKLYSSGVLGLLPFFLIGFIRRTFHLLKCINADFVFIHREVTPVGPPIFEWMLAKVLRKKIIYDFDDAIWLEDPDEKDTLKSKLKWKSKVAKICKWSYKVSCGNHYLAEFAKKYSSHVIVNPTTVDTKRLHNPNLFFNREQKTPIIGWTGTHSTLQYLKSIIPILEQLELKFEFIFLVIANSNPKFKLKSFKFLPWNQYSEIEDLMQIDIGIMPLTNDEWSKGKCGFKLLQYMALEKPVIASPVGVNKEIINNGINGYLCNTDNEWYGTLEKLLLTNNIENLGIQGRKKVVSNYSIKSNTLNFLRLFT